MINKSKSMSLNRVKIISIEAESLENLNSYQSLSLFSHRELNVLLLCLHLYIICSMTWLWYRCDYAYERNYFHVWLIYTANACSAIYWQTLYRIVVYFVFAPMRFNSRFIHQFYIKVCCVQLHMCVWLLLVLFIWMKLWMRLTVQ